MPTQDTIAAYMARSNDPMERLAHGLVDLLDGMISARQDLGMTDPDEIAGSIMDSLHNMIGGNR